MAKKATGTKTTGTASRTRKATTPKVEIEVRDPASVAQPAGNGAMSASAATSGDSSSNGDTGGTSGGGTVIGTATAPREVTHQMIAERAYEIHLSGTGGSPDENWYRAERELRG